MFLSAVPDQQIRRNLSVEAIKLLVNAFVISRLDYSNSLLVGYPPVQCEKLQLVLNAAARVVFGRHKCMHITSVLRDDLHSLKYPFQVDFKLCTLVYKALQGTAPLSYLSCVFLQTDVGDELHCDQLLVINY